MGIDYAARQRLAEAEADMPPQRKLGVLAPARHVRRVRLGSHITELRADTRAGLDRLQRVLEGLAARRPGVFGRRTRLTSGRVEFRRAALREPTA